PGQGVQYTIQGSPTHNATVKMVYNTAATVNSAGSGSYPRSETSAVSQQLPRLAVWNNSLLKQSLSQLDSAASKLSATMKSLSSYDSVLSVRTEFIDEMTATLEGGADRLTLA